MRTVVLVAGVLAMASAFAADLDTHFRSNSDLVLINATVVDGHDRIVTHLDRDQFRVLDGRQEMRLTSVAVEETPVSVVVLLDASGSMKRVMSQSVAALDVLLDSLRPDDEVSLLAIHNGVKTVLPFTQDFGTVREAARLLTASGPTALLDGIGAGFSMGRHARYPRKALMIFSDGGERDSRFEWREVRSMARESGMRLFPFLVWSAADDFQWEQAELRAMAEDTGGRLYAVSRARNLTAEVAKIPLHQQFVLAFAPDEAERDGRFRRVKVELRNTSKDLRVFWKHGYFAPNEE
ncbi:MAG: VWA domain-containing protein [Bryobacteraceae bacterium]